MRPTRHLPATGRLLLTSAVVHLAALTCPAAPPRPPTPPATTFPHDVHHPLPLPTPEANDVQAIALGPDASVWIATADGTYRLQNSAAPAPWQRLDPPSPGTPSPAFDLAVLGPDEAWVALWNGIGHWKNGTLTRVPGHDHPVSRLAPLPDGGLLVAGPDGFHHLLGSVLTPIPLNASRQVSDMVVRPDGTAWLATGMGLFQWNPDQPARGAYVRGPFTTASLAVRSLAFDAQGQLWAATLGGLQRFNDHRLRQTLTPRDGLPSSDVRAVASDPRSGRLWVGTAQGVARRDPGQSTWVIRTGRRWLLSDDVRDLAVSADGTAWIATAAGVSALKSTNLALAEKAQTFHAILEARHVRPPGIVEKCRLRIPGDLSTWGPEDDDNDGGYTALALAMESFRYAATGDPTALAAARRAFAACEFLQTVTGTPGFLARTVIPSDWTEMHDPNRVLSPVEQARERVGDPRTKYVPVRWRPSADGRWLWKGDTSSDEMTAHFFGYFAYHQLVTLPEDRQRVRNQVVRLADHLLASGFVLRDLDGQPTRWGIWAPERLNHDPDWAMERGINSTEILSFLKVAHHLSGEPRFEAAYNSLIRDHHYDRNVLEAPNLNPAWRTYIDFELLAFAYPALLELETDPRLARIYRQSFEQWHNTIRADGNPFFEFLYARHASPRRANLTRARTFLIDTPLDLIRWDVQLDAREDLSFQRWPEVEHRQTTRLLPMSELGYSRTDQNPWRMHQGDGGRTESDGVFWLLPYWMGRHHGWIAP